ncbi:MAG: DNA polymerase III subunit beta [Candidatus Omnitrophota bacterium]
MKFSINKDILLQTAQLVQNAINTKSNLPILSNILIDAEPERIILTATDLDIGITSEIPVKSLIQGSITVPAKKFLDIIKELPNEETLITVKKNNIINIDCKNTSLKLMGLSKEEFPQLPHFQDKDFVILPQRKLKQMLSLTSFAISSDETRYVLNGILCIIKPSYIRLVATDGRRLAVAETPMQFPKSKETKTIIPTKTVQELSRMLTNEGEVKVYFSKNQIAFDFGATKIISRIIEGDFPNYEQVIPKETKEKIKVSRDVFLSATKRANIFTNQNSIAVKVALSCDKMVISKNDSYVGEIREELNVEYKGKDITIGFNPEYLIDVLKAVDEETLNFEVTDSEKPAAFRIGKEYVYVVLPMQL